MRILTAIRTSYPPAAKSGADVMCERICTFLAGKGHEVVVTIEDCPKEYIYKGVKVTSSRQLLGEKYDWCDIVLTNLVYKGEAMLLAQRFNKPIFHIVHNNYGCNVPPGTADNYLIFNSYHLQNTCGYGLQSVVVNPPTWVNDWQNDINHYNNPYITLVNCVQNKGFDMLSSLARAMPWMKFLAVHGGYGMPGRKIIPNLSYLPFQNDSSEIYKQTKIIIVPSIAESWSLVAAEAQASGIPVICSDLPGIRENLGMTGLYAGTVRRYMDAVNMLGDWESYEGYVKAGRLRQAENETNIIQQLENLNNFMEKVDMEKKGVDKPNAVAEIVDEIREKAQHIPIKEKKIINKPGQPVKIK